jgi:hypothetical protein
MHVRDELLRPTLSDALIMGKQFSPMQRASPLLTIVTLVAASTITSPMSESLRSQPTMVGGSKSSTTTLKLHVELMPALFVTVTETSVTPRK